MKLFGGTTPQERAISTLIHDHNGGLGMARNYISMLEKELRRNTPAQPIEYYIQKIKDSITRCQKEVDAYCEKAKNDFQ